MIPKESTPIKHTILIEIIAQGRLTYDEVRIASFVMRWSWGFDEGVRRQDWTKDFTISEIAKEIKMDRGLCSRTINKMVNDGKLLRDENKYQFNEHYENWKVLQKVTHVAKSNMLQKVTGSVAKSNTPVAKSNTSVAKSNTHDIQETLIKKDLEGKNALRKDTLKILNNKDTLKISTVEAHPKIIFNNQAFKFENIPKEKLNKWKEAFPNCNVDIELKKMEAWLAANPERRKKNYEKFIVNWLARAKGEKANGKYIPITVGKAKFKGGTANAGEW